MSGIVVPGSDIDCTGAQLPDSRQSIRRFPARWHCGIVHVDDSCMPVQIVWIEKSYVFWGWCKLKENDEFD
jgi:hypothetical protein